MLFEQLLVLQAEMRRRLREDKKSRKTLVRQKYHRPEVPPVDFSTFPTKIENGQTITMCPPAYDRDLEYDRPARQHGRSDRGPVDEHEEIENQIWPSKSVYRALCHAANAGSYPVLDRDESPESQQTGHQLARRLITVIQNCLRKNKPLPLAWQELLGCDLEYFQEHVEKLFRPGMTWGNWGEWHLDHIKPLVSFSLDFRPELLAACNYRNLQPLWAPDNCSKGGRVEG